MKEKELDPNILHQIFKMVSADLIKKKHSLRKKRNYWPCCFPGCNEKAINSHLLQQNGVLDRIAENGHVIRYHEVPSQNMGLSFELRPVGVRDALAYPVFCNHHDTYIFESIELQPLDLTQKWDNILLAYRSTATERRKKEIIKEMNHTILEKKKEDFIDQPQFVNAFKNDIDSYDKAINRLKNEELYLGQFLNNEFSYDKFDCFHVILPKIDICCTSLFSYIESIEDGRRINLPLYFNLIPLETTSICSLSWIKEHHVTVNKFVSKFFTSERELDYFKFISDILLSKVENWVVAPSFYEKYLKENEQKICEYFSNNIDYKEYNAQIEFNMFDIFLFEYYGRKTNDSQ